MWNCEIHLCKEIHRQLFLLLTFFGNLFYVMKIIVALVHLGFVGYVNG